MEKQLRIFVGISNELAEKLKAKSPEELTNFVSETFDMTELDPEQLHRHKFLCGVVAENMLDKIKVETGVEWVEVDSEMKAI